MPFFRLDPKSEKKFRKSHNKNFWPKIDHIDSKLTIVNFLLGPLANLIQVSNRCSLCLFNWKVI